MVNSIFRTIESPVRLDLTWDERWLGVDKGLISCWETGRQLRVSDPSLAARAENGELPALIWKGGIDTTPKLKKKFGSLNYLAAWMGLRNSDLEIDMVAEPKLTCSRTSVEVTFTTDPKKLCLGI